MNLPGWHEEPVAKAHDRDAFDCGDADLNVFLRRYARQSHEMNASKTFCAISDAQPNRVLGFYTLAPASVDYAEVPSHMTRRIARHEVPGFRLARLAVDVSMAGKGLGGQLLAAAALRCLRLANDGGGLLLIIDAKSDRAASWYRSFGAEPLQDSPLTLVIPLAVFAPGLKAKGLL